MNATASSSRIPARPRPKPVAKRPIFDGDVIDLTELDDSPPKKRKRANEYDATFDSDLDSNRTVDLTKTLSFTEDDFFNPWADEGNTSKNAKAGPSNSQEKVLQDSTNTGEHRDTPLLVGDMTDNVDSLDTYLAQILEVIPDVDPAHVRKLLETHYPAFNDTVAPAVLDILFSDASYPKSEKKLMKRKEEEAAEKVKHSKNPAEDYESIDRDFRGDSHYIDRSLGQLFYDFSSIPKSYIRHKFFDLNALYAPTHLFLLEEQKNPDHAFKALLAPRPKEGKNKGKDKIPGISPEYDRERAWLLERLSGKTEEGLNANADKSPEPQSASTAVEATTSGEIECGCCFGEYSFDQMVQCPDAHLFCQTCVTQYVSDRLGQHQSRLECMDQSNCKLVFPDSELTRILPEKLLSLYHKLKQMKEIEDAGLEGLEECPFCDFKVVIDNANEKLFRCQNGECMAVSCRACKRPDHLPRTCQEVDQDKHLDARHAVEEAMTSALMRNCPKCKKPFVKEAGCNKMTCPHCHTLSCYICRQVITGYQHFDPGPPHNKVRDPTKCPLWDIVEQRHDTEVAAAAEKAMEEVRKANPGLDEEQITVELPKTAEAAAAARPPQPGYHPYLIARLEHMQHPHFPFQAVVGGPVPHPPILEAGMRVVPGRQHHAAAVADRAREAGEAFLAAEVGQRDDRNRHRREARMHERDRAFAIADLRDPAHAQAAAPALVGRLVGQAQQPVAAQHAYAPAMVIPPAAHFAHIRHARQLQAAAPQAHVHVHVDPRVLIHHPRHHVHDALHNQPVPVNVPNVRVIEHARNRPRR